MLVLIPRGLARLMLFGYVVSSFLWAWRGSSMIRMFVLRTYRHVYMSVMLMFLWCTIPTCVDNATANKERERWALTKGLLRSPFLAPPPTVTRANGSFFRGVSCRIHSQHSESHRAPNHNSVHWWRKSCLLPTRRCKAGARKLGLDVTDEHV